MAAPPAGALAGPSGAYPAGGHAGISAIPTDLSITRTTARGPELETGEKDKPPASDACCPQGPVTVVAGAPALNQPLFMYDAALQALYARIPGLQAQVLAFETAESGPFTLGTCHVADGGACC